MTTSHQRHPRWPVPVTLFALVALSSVLLPVVPWPRDHWFESQYLIFGSHADSDNYSPIAAPAFLYAGIHWLAHVLNLDLRGEFYLASAIQSAMLFCSFLLLYSAMRDLRLPRPALTSILALCLVLSTGLPQTFNSENVCFFLTAVLLYGSVRIYVGTKPGVRFVGGTIVVGTAVGLLVLTRMIPVIFIPGLIWLAAKRLGPSQRLVFGGTLTLLTTAVLLWLFATNHDRFGRFELTSSNGRHLWQGAKELTDRALQHVPEYQALKRAHPEIGGAPSRLMPWNRGSDHWEVPYPDEVPGLEQYVSLDGPRERQQDALLKMLASETIRSEPILYAASGAYKFLKTIGGAPYQLGFLYGDGFYNPLGLNVPLPPLIDSTRLLGVDATRPVLDVIHRALRVIYPLTICVVSVTLLAMCWLRLRVHHAPRQTVDFRVPRRVQLTLFGVVAAGLAAIACLGRLPDIEGTQIEDLMAFVCSAAVIAAQLRVLQNLPAQLEDGLISEARLPHQRLYVCLILLFFVSLWLSWQVEVALSRYAVPYLPLLILMLGIAVGFWRSLAAQAHRGMPSVQACNASS